MFQHTRSRLFKDIAYLGLCFSILFVAFNVVQSFITTIFPDLGFYILLVVYALFGVFSVLAPTCNSLVTRYVSPAASERVLMTGGAVTYVLFIAAAASGNPVLVMIGAALNGAGAGLLWICQGVYVTKMVAAYEAFNHSATVASGKPAIAILGTATGIFFGVYNLNSIVGNGIALVILYSGGNLQSMTWAMAVIALLATGMMTMASSVHGVEEVSVKKTLEKSGLDFSPLWKLVRQRKALLLMPYMLCQGINVSYNYGNIPTYIAFVTERAFSSTKDAETVKVLVNANVAWTFLMYGVGALIGSVVWGKLYDLYHRSLTPLLTSHVVLIVTNFAILLSAVFFQTDFYKSIFPMFMIVGFIIGAVDFLTNAIINNSVSHFFTAAEAPWGFCLYRVMFCVGFVIHAALSGALPGVQGQTTSTGFAEHGWLILVVLNVGIMMTSVFCGFLLEYRSPAAVALARDIDFVNEFVDIV